MKGRLCGDVSGHLAALTRQLTSQALLRKGNDVLTSIIKRVVGVVAGLALVAGLTLATATPASAGSVWDKVAQCETGQRWKTNSVPGYSGGLGFLHSSWSGYGGKKYAKRAHQASKAEQIAVARRILADVGRGAWPTCGRRANLTKANGKAHRHATPSTNPGGSSSSSSSSSGHTWTKKERSFAHKNARVKKPANRSFIAGKTVRVKRGDDLLKIARRNHVKGGWKAVYKLNQTKFNSQVKQGKRIFIGQVVRIKK